MTIGILNLDMMQNTFARKVTFTVNGVSVG